MNLEVKGHSGCRIDVISENGTLYVNKSTHDAKYLARLALQAEKQKAAAEIPYQHIRVPEVYGIERTDDKTVVKMQYVYSKNFVEFFEQAGFEQIDYLIGALKYFIEYEIGRSTIQKVAGDIFRDKFADLRARCRQNPLLTADSQLDVLLDRSERIFRDLIDLEIPVGLCHGDLTFSNILFNGNNYYLIDFLDGFIETPLQDIVKIRQDTAYHWSQLMYTKRYDAVRLNIVCDKIDREIDGYFRDKYGWYRNWYPTMQLMNILRILPYTREERILCCLKKMLADILDGVDSVGMCQAAESGQRHVASTSARLSLIVPAAADKPEYENGLPYIFALDQDGIVICLKSILGLELDKFDAIYFTILKKHNKRFFISDLLDLQFRRLNIGNAKVVILDEPTIDQAETVYRTIQQEKIDGSIFIKDADSYFTAELPSGNGIAIYPIEALDVLTPRDKSYVSVDDMYYITNVIEKSVVGHYISAGGYFMRDVAEFCRYYRRLRSQGRLYLSHIIYAMLLDKKTYRPMIAGEYKDWGTVNDWKRNE